MRILSCLALPIALVAALGCSDDTTETTTSSTTSSTTSTGDGGGGQGGGGQGGGGTAGPIGGDRPVEVFTPSTYQEGTPMPLVILLHGYTTSGLFQEAYFKMQPLAEQHGFLYAHPDGTKNSRDDRFWNASDACCDFEDSMVDDSAYLRSVIDEIKERYTVDPKRVYFAGHSNGGFMSYRMACDHADAIAAIASLAGAMPFDATQCAPSEPVAVLQIHGTADDVVLYDGGMIVGVSYPGALESVQQWAELNGCDTTPADGPTYDLEGQIAGAETSSQAFTGCDPGGHAELWSIDGGGHSPSLSPDFAAQIVEFFFAHPKP